MWITAVGGESGEELLGEVSEFDVSCKRILCLEYVLNQRDKLPKWCFGIEAVRSEYAR
jgi:hypothetical protein